jgi:tetratricopeptide (TPR) repeat protein
MCNSLRFAIADFPLAKRNGATSIAQRIPRIAACRAALDLRPNYADAWNNICAGYNKLGRHEEAAAACEQALRYKSDFELAHNNPAIRSQDGEGLGQAELPGTLPPIIFHWRLSGQ